MSDSASSSSSVCGLMESDFVSLGEGLHSTPVIETQSKSVAEENLQSASVLSGSNQHYNAFRPTRNAASPLKTLVVKLHQPDNRKEKKAGKRGSGRLSASHSTKAQAASWSEHALAYCGAKRYDKALECAEQALRLDTELGSAWQWRGTALMQLQRIPEAAQSFQSAVALRPRDAEAWVGFGRALLQLEMYQQAIKSFACALHCAPNHCDALIYQARACALLLQYQPACASFDRALKLKPNDASLWHEYAETLLRAKQTDAALECYESITQINPTDAHNWWRLANLLCQLGRPAEAIAGYHTALELAPHVADLWCDRGQALATMGRFEDAAKSFQHALDLPPKTSADQHRPRYHLALTHLQRFLEALEQGRVFNAKEHWQKATQLGREARMPDWYAQELHYLQAAAVLGHQRMVKALITRLDGNDLLAPLNCALDFLLTNDQEKVTSLPTHIRYQVERIINFVNPCALCPVE